MQTKLLQNMPKPLKAAAAKNQNKKVRLTRSLPSTNLKRPRSPPKDNTDPKSEPKRDKKSQGTKTEKAKGKEPAKVSEKTSEHDATKHNKPALPRTFRIIAGTYEKLLYGLEASFKETVSSDSNEPSTHRLQLKTLFIFPAHVACVKTVAASPTGGKWLATGSADEIIKVWDLRRLKEVGGLMHHTGSITHLTFPSRSHLMSASEDGTLCLFHTRDWEVLRSMKGHKGRINNIAVHPSSKIALSVGKDKTLRMWDLMRGKGAASTKLGKEGETVRWSTSGTRFAVQSGSNVVIHSLKLAVLSSIVHPSRVHDIRFFHPDHQGVEYLLVGAEDKKVTIYELPMDNEESSSQPKVVGELVGHQNRVKAVDLITIQTPPYGEPRSRTYATTISSDGFIRIYDLTLFVEKVASKNDTDARVVLESVAHFDTSGSRLTCLSLADGEMVAPDNTAGVKRKREQKEEGGDLDSEYEGLGINGDLENGEEENEEEAEAEVEVEVVPSPV